MGDSSTLNVVSDAPVALVSAKAVQPDSSGDTSSYERQAVLKDEVDSTFFVNLSAGDDSEVNTNSILYAKGVLGSGSALTLSSEDVTAGEGEQITRTDHLFADPNWGHKLGAAFYGSLTQAEDDVPNTISVVSDSSDVGYSKLGGWTDENGQTYDVNVGTVNVKSGTLEMT